MGLNNYMRTISRPLASDGYLRDWLYLGAFGGDPEKLIRASQIPEAKCAPSVGESAGGLRWQAVSAVERVLDFTSMVGHLNMTVNCCAYLHTYLYSPTQMRALLLLGSDDGVAVWTNGTRVFALSEKRGCVADTNAVPVELDKGWNRLLLKVTQWDGGWQVMMRVAGCDGNPISGMRVAVNEPTGGVWKVNKSAARPIVLGLTPPASAAFADATPEASLEFGLSIRNVSAAATEPGRASVFDAAGKELAGVNYPALESLGVFNATVTLAAHAWAAAWNAPCRAVAMASKSELSLAFPVRPGVLTTFLHRTRQLADLTAADGALLAGVRNDLEVDTAVAGEFPALGRGLAAFLAALDQSDTAAFSASLRRLHAVVAECSAAIKKKAVFLIGHGHIDMNWLWRWPETIQMCQDTFSQALRFMKEFPDFRYSQSQAATYEAMEQEDPALFAEIKKAVKAGSWEVTGGMWTEGDTNLASGEALCRSFLLAQRYFREKLGTQAKVGWLPDNFGHAAQLPQMLNLAGIQAFYHMRCRPQPQLYWWEGIDGSRVLAKTGQGYSDKISPAIRAEPDRLPAPVNAQMFTYGVGDHGGGPTRADIQRAKSLQKIRLFPTVKFARTSEYFDHVRPLAGRAPVHKGELQYVFDGCYTTVSRIKQGNRSLENALQAAEALAVVAAQHGVPYPADELREAWKLLVFNQFHDILPGSAIHDSNQDSQVKYQQGIEICRRIRLRSLRALGAKVAIKNDDTLPVLVFNPLAFGRSDITVAELVITRPISGIRLRTGDGVEIPAQIIRTRNYGCDYHIWLRFTAADIPGLGYEVYFAEPLEGHPPVPVSSFSWNQPYSELSEMPSVEAEGISLVRNRVRNRFFECVFSQTDGTITSLRLFTSWKPRENMVGKGGANRLGIYLEHPQGDSAWNLDPTAEGPFALNVTKAPVVRQQGPEAVSWVTEFRYNASKFRLTTTIHADSPRIDSTLAAEWVERGDATTNGPMLRLHHSLAGAAKKLTCDVPFAALEREGGREVPAQKWAAVKVAGGTLAMLNRGKYGHSLDGSVLRLSLLRAAYFPDPLPDVGRHEIEWSLQPHAGACDIATLARAGLAYNVPFETFQLRQQPGTLDTRYSLLAAEGSSNFLVTAVKHSEDGRALIIRGYDANGTGGNGALAGALKARSASRVNTLEDAMDGEVRVAANGRIETTMRPWEIVAIKVPFPNHLRLESSANQRGRRKP